MSFLDSALELAKKGFHVFPLIPNSKLPLIEDFPHRATTDPQILREWWIDPILGLEQPYNVGISTSHFGKDEALVVIDVDNKGDKNGDRELAAIGIPLPETYTQITPTGGRHVVFRTPRALKQGSDVLGRGLDIRSRGGYIVGAGSSLERGAYAGSGSHVAGAPDWLVTRCGISREPQRRLEPAQPAGAVDPVRAKARGLGYLEKEAPLSLEGSSGDQTAFLVACKLKDMGCSNNLALELMVESWNDRCVPPWDLSDLKIKVDNAYRYGADPIGVNAPEVEFTKIEESKTPHPFDELNKKFAYIAGNKGLVIHETTDVDGRFFLEHIAVPTFHQNEAAKILNLGQRTVP